MVIPWIEDIRMARGVSSALMAESRTSAADAIVEWARKRITRRLKNGTFNEKELERILRAVIAAGDAEGYARAKAEMALMRGENSATG